MSQPLHQTMTSKPIIIYGFGSYYRYITASLLVVFLLILLITATFIKHRSHSTSSTPLLSQTRHIQTRSDFAHLPLSFEKNQGQSSSSVHFLARGLGYLLQLMPNKAIFSLPGNQNSSNSAGFVPITMHILGSSERAKMIAEHRLPGLVNDLSGNDADQWLSAIPTYQAVRAEHIYPGIDIRYYGNHGQFEYDFILQPGAQVDTIRLAFSGVKTIHLDSKGNLLLDTTRGTLVHRHPAIYQEINGKHVNIEGHYQIYPAPDQNTEGRQQLGFVVADYDPNRKLIIDPVLEFSSYLGSNQNDQGLALSTDEGGNSYVAGITQALNLSTTGVQTQGQGSTDAFVFKLNPQGNVVLYTTYFGGQEDERDTHLAVDKNGQIYLSGITSSAHDLPIKNALQTQYGGGSSDLYLAKLSADGEQIIYATYLGGRQTEQIGDITINAQQEVYITGSTYSADFPVAMAFQHTLNGKSDLFITKLNASATELVFSSYLGSAQDSNADASKVNAISLDTQQNIYLAGKTRSTHFPVSADAVQPILAGSSDGFIIKLPPDASTIEYATFFGGSKSDTITGLTIDHEKQITVVGTTQSEENFPLTENAWQAYFGGGQTDAFISRINIREQRLIFSTFLGGSDNDQANGLSIGAQQSIWVVGTTLSKDFPQVDSLQNTLSGGKDGFISQLQQNGTQLIFSSYLGGSQEDSIRAIATDFSGNVYITGSTQSGIDFPLFAPLQPTYGGGGNDAFIVKLFALPAAHEQSTQVDASACMLDIDDNGSADALTDGLLIIRYLFGFTGNVLIDSAIDPHGTRSTATDIETYLGTCFSVFDVDDNGSSDALTDGLLILRYLFGFSGSVLTENAIDPQGNRTSATDISNYLQQRLPLDNQAPIITSIPITSATVDQPYHYQLVANDPDNDPINYTLTASPLGMSLDNNGIISWLPRHSGTTQVTINIHDNRGGQSSQSFELNSTFAIGAGNLPPQLAPIGNQTISLGSTLTVQLSATDNDLVTYAAEPLPLAHGMSLDTYSGLFRFTPTEAGQYTLKLTATDGRFSDTENITITVPETDHITRLSGKILTTDAAPLANVRLEIAGIETFTDNQGNYLLDNIPVSGDVRLLVDGATVDAALGTFATVPEIVHLIVGADNVLNPPIILLPLDIASADPVNPTRTSTITSSEVIEGYNNFPPVKLTIPPGAAINDGTGLPFIGDIHISRIADPTQGPRPLPDDIGLSAYIAIQPFGVTYPEPVPISFPNLEDFPPGSRMDFFALNHETGKMEKIGEGLVSADGKTVDSIGGVVKSNSWHGIVPQQPVANPALPPFQSEPPEGGKICPACSFDLQTGNMSEQYRLPAYTSLQQSRSVRLQYNSNNALLKPVIPVVSGFGNRAPPPQTMSMQLSIGGINYTEEKFSQVRVESAGIGQFKTTRPAIQFDASLLTTGIYDYELTIECQFPISFRAETVPGQLIVNNQRNNAFGAGWSLVNLQRLHTHHDGKILLTTGSASSLIFVPVDNTQYRSPPGDFSSLIRLTNDHYQRRLPNGTVYLFDSTGLLIQETDRNGNHTDYLYDAQQRIEQIIDPVGSGYQFSYFAGRINSITDPLNRITRFEHDAEGNLIKIIEANADERQFEYQPQTHLMTAQLDQRGNRKQYQYDFAGRIQSALLPDSSHPQVAVNAVQGLIDTTAHPATRENPAPPPPLEEDIHNQYTDHNGNLTVTESDPLNAALQRTDAIGRVTSYQRDENSKPTQTTRPNTSIIQRSFNAQGKATRVREVFNNATRNYSYDSHNLVTQFTNPNSHSNTINRDAQGNAEQIINHLGHSTQMNYDSRGLLTEKQDPNGLISTYLYNTQGLVEQLTETPPPGSADPVRITHFNYDAAGQNTRIITPDGITMDMDYDSKGRLITLTDNAGQSIEYTYDAYNNLIQTDTHNSDGSLARSVQQAYDVRNRLESTRVPHSDNETAINQRILDNNSNLTGQIDPNGNSSHTIYDAEDRLIENTHRLGGISQYQYDSNNRITKITAANGATTDYSYDLLGRRLTETSPDRGTRSYQYDKADNITRITDGRGISVTLHYDALERIIRKTYPNTITGKDETVIYHYDNCLNGIGRLCSRTDESGTDLYEYDIYGNIITLTHSELGINYHQHYQYDAGNHLTQITYPNGRVVNYQRDEIKRLHHIEAELNGNKTTLIDNISYRADQRITRKTYGNGLIDTRSYDQQGRITTQQLSNAQNHIDQRNYAYDLNGNIIEKTSTPQDNSYRYDARDRLVADSKNNNNEQQFDYDLNDNRIRQQQAINSLIDQYIYKDNSNQLSSQTRVVADNAPPPVNDRELVYNDAGRLYQLIDNGELKAEYIYNDHGLRSRKILHHSDGSTQIIIYHYTINNQLISETNQNGQLIRDYIWMEAGYPVAQIDQNNGTERLLYLHNDHLMTARLATDTNQNIVWHWDGDAFGGTEPVASGGVSVNMRFPGQYFDLESGLFYNWNRYYDPYSGRYVTSDPIGLQGGLNTYQYVNANPFIYIDANGLRSCIDPTECFNFCGVLYRECVKLQNNIKQECKKISKKVCTKDPDDPSPGAVICHIAEVIICKTLPTVGGLITCSSIWGSCMAVCGFPQGDTPCELCE